MNFAGVKILVLGDVMLDHYIVGRAGRISPEAPVPVVNRERAWTVPGGAANVARGLARLGCEARLVGLAARDAAGETLRKEVLAEGITAALISAGSRPTSCKTRIMAGGQQLLRVDDEVIRMPSLEERVAMLRHVEELLDGCSALVISDYAKGVLLRDAEGRSVCQDAISMAAEAGLPVLVDPKGTDWSRYAGASCVTPNSREFDQVCGAAHVATGKLAEEATQVCAKFDLARLLLTRGSRGMVLFEPGEAPRHIRSVAREVADVSGAGDTVVTVLAACIAKGEGWLKGAEIANTAAGLAVAKLGTAPVNLGELNGALREKNVNPKLLSPAELERRLSEWRNHGRKIVFTNGCFDLLHPGHVALLRESAAMGDILIVGLNTDASVRRLKGPERPIQNEQSRAQVLAALESVDAVALFDEDTPERLIREVRPDILVKGSDYRPENIVGADFVRSQGGEVRLVNIVEGCSTTGLVQQMKGGKDVHNRSG